jgi:hypothetical protein
MFEHADLISAYSRSQALADGVLIDVSVPASLMGFLYPVWSENSNSFRLVLA